jgi:hypothetical protein
MAPAEPIPSFLFDTYSKYKSDTSLFVSWLGETAKKCGSDILTASKVSGPTGKSHARKKSKEQQKIVFSLGELPRLARTIANSDAEIPEYILLVLRNVIRARNGFAGWFDRWPGDSQHYESNKTHRGAIDVFQAVLSILLCGGSSETPKSKYSAFVEDDVEDSSPKNSNSFAALDLEDIVNEDDEVHRTLPPKTASEPQKSWGVTYSWEDYWSGILIATYCFYKDMNEVRNYIKQLWRDYQARKVDLVVSCPLRYCFGHQL